MVKMFFGPPGCGKSTFAARVVYLNNKKGFKTFSNYPIQGAYLFDPLTDLGVFNISDCDIIIDEASIEFHSRKFKTFSDVLIEFFKKNRHYHIRDIYIFSQGWDDVDKVIRTITVRYYIMRKSLLPHFSYYRRISRNYGEIDKLSKQIIDGYSYVPFSRRYIFLPKYWNMFDSYEHKPLPEKEFILIGRSDDSIEAVERRPL